MANNSWGLYHQNILNYFTFRHICKIKARVNDKITPSRCHWKLDASEKNLSEVKYDRKINLTSIDYFHESFSVN